MARRASRVRGSAEALKPRTAPAAAAAGSDGHHQLRSRRRGQERRGRGCRPAVGVGRAAAGGRGAAAARAARTPPAGTRACRSAPAGGAAWSGPLPGPGEGLRSRACGARTWPRRPRSSSSASVSAAIGRLVAVAAPWSAARAALATAWRPVSGSAAGGGPVAGAAPAAVQQQRAQRAAAAVFEQGRQLRDVAVVRVALGDDDQHGVGGGGHRDSERVIARTRSARRRTRTASRNRSSTACSGGPE